MIDFIMSNNIIMGFLYEWRFMKVKKYFLLAILMMLVFSILCSCSKTKNTNNSIIKTVDETNSIRFDGVYYNESGLTNYLCFYDDGTLIIDARLIDITFPELKEVFNKDAEHNRERLEYKIIEDEFFAEYTEYFGEMFVNGKIQDDKIIVNIRTIMIDYEDFPNKKEYEIKNEYLFHKW
jgi:hypothetical protein